MDPAWPKRIGCCHGWVTTSGMPIKRVSQKTRSDNVFVRARKSSKMFRAGLYARVSTNDQQTLPMQSHAMREYAAGSGWTIAVKIRGRLRCGQARGSREIARGCPPTREGCSAGVAAGPPGRSVTDLLATLQELEHLGVGFVPLTEALDLTTPVGRARAGRIAVLASLEREVLQERTRAGLARAREDGKRLGRPATAATHTAELRRLYRTGISRSEIARRLQIGRTSVRCFLGVAKS